MKANTLSISKRIAKPTLNSSPARIRHLPRFTIAQPYWFFAHVALAFDHRSHAASQATSNLLIEVENKIVRAHDRQKHRKVSEPDDAHAAEVAGKSPWRRRWIISGPNPSFGLFRPSALLSSIASVLPTFQFVRRRQRFCPTVRESGGWRKARPITCAANRILFVIPTSNNGWPLTLSSRE